MDSTEDNDLDALLTSMDTEADAQDTIAAPIAHEPPRRDSSRLLSRIPVKLTLEVGTATVSLAELTEIQQGSVIELDRLAGEPLLIKVNDIVVGHAEVVVSGGNYGLRVLDLEDLGILVS